ncbi:hypothetical protein EDD85DRAFT_974688 [Armillaria nabsnona]|nr:hypothetical protein EDD85DRAFT_974688 [Armillaria nabsnona]
MQEKQDMGEVGDPRRFLVTGEGERLGHRAKTMTFVQKENKDVKRDAKADMKQGGRCAMAHEKDMTGRQARYTETGPTHRNRNKTGTETPEQRSTGTRNANPVAAVHANTGNTMHGNGAREWNRKKGVSQVEETRNKGAHDKLAKIPIADNIKYRGLFPLELVSKSKVVSRDKTVLRLTCSHPFDCRIICIILQYAGSGNPSAGSMFRADSV